MMGLLVVDGVTGVIGVAGVTGVTGATGVSELSTTTTSFSSCGTSSTTREIKISRSLICYLSWTSLIVDNLNLAYLRVVFPTDT